jgi:hypothetical protein
MMWPTKSGHRDNAVNCHKVVNDDNKVTRFQKAARSLDVGENQLRHWKQKFEEDATGEGLNEDEREEMKLSIHLSGITNPTGR